MKILIVDDEDAARYGMRRALEQGGYTIAEAASVGDARRTMEKTDFDLLLLDINMPGENGLDFLGELRAREERAPLVVIVTAHGTERTAATAIKNGAYDYLAKPFEIDELRLIAKNAAETLHLRRESRALHRRVEIESERESSLIGESEEIERVRRMINKVAQTDATILIRGESGTGKELVAREIHTRAARLRPGAFVAVNCAALPAELIESELFGHEKGAFTGAAAKRLGKFEQADGGTLFLDEIGDMSPNVQAKLLRALEEQRIERLGGNTSVEVDARIISATHRNLEAETEKGSFRADLFYRLRVVTIELPALRERRADIPVLTRLFLQRAEQHYNRHQLTISPQAERQLAEYDFPGNVRELRNMIDRAVVLADDGDTIESFAVHKNATANSDSFVIAKGAENETVTAKQAGASPAQLNDESDALNNSVNDSQSDKSLVVPYTADFRQDRREFERLYLARCLDEADGNVTRAAVSLGMHRQSLQHKLRELGLARRYIAVE